jgi:hypothetical protein
VERIWKAIDEDGNDVINFAEFIEWARTKPKELGYARDFPVGLNEDDSAFGKCKWLGCPCEAFHAKHGFFCECGHKKGVHQLRENIDDSIAYPESWNWNNADLNVRAAASSAEIKAVQLAFDSSYRNTWTRDRGKDVRVPKGFEVISAKKNVNTKVWRMFWLKRQHVLKDVDKDGSVSVYQVKTSPSNDELTSSIDGSSTRMEEKANEWFLFHGTKSQKAVDAIMEGDFSIRHAGTATGTLYGNGVYFAESITKADEYARPDDKGVCTVLLCRIIGGRVHYNDEVDPDPQALQDSVLFSQFNCVLGDREKCRNTYKEFVIYDTDQIYCAYEVKYRRITA